MLAAGRPQPRTRSAWAPNVGGHRPGEDECQQDGESRTYEVRMNR
jgi:hypothetical protein